MFQRFSRILAMLLCLLILFILGAIFWGKQNNDLSAVFIQSRSRGGYSQYTILDIETQIRHQTDNITYYNTSPNRRWQLREEWTNSELHIDIRSAYGLDFRQLGTYAIPAEPHLAWTPDSEAVLVGYKLRDENLIINQINIATGDMTAFGEYDFTGIPISIFLLNESMLIVWHFEGFMLIDTTTREVITAQDTRLYTGISPDGRYLLYGRTIQFGGTQPEDSILYILDLETLETITLYPEDFGGGISNVIQWSPTDTILPIADINNNIILYDIETQTQERLPPEYGLYSTFPAWSSDGTRLIVVKRLNEEEIAYVSLNLETGEEVQFLTGFDRELNTQRLYYYYPQSLMWSPDNRYILSKYNQTSSRLVYDIYDAQTGELLYEVNEYIVGAQDVFVNWWWMN